MELWASILMVVVSFAAMLLSGFTYERSVRRGRKQATLDAFNLLQQQAFDPLNGYTPGEIETICRTVSEIWWGERKSNEADLARFLKLSGYAARIEHFALGVNTGIYDVRIAERAGTTYWSLLYDKKLRPLIEVKNRKAGGREYYIEFYEMMKKIKRLEKKNEAFRLKNRPPL